jgi:PAS domain S-box-containing protein
MGGATSMAGRARSISRSFPPQPSSVGEARRMVRGLLADTDRDDLGETAALLVSEVVTNALLHAGTIIDVTAAVGDEGLRVEVGDGSPHFPVRRRYAATAGTGRGMMMLESLVDDWGVVTHRRGKTVWFHISSGDSEDDDPTALQMDDTVDHGRRATVDVVLLNVPMLLHVAWQEHAAALLREYLLASIDLENSDHAIQVHADATDAMAILEEYIPTADVTVVSDQLMTEATEPNVSCPRVEVDVPSSSVPHFQTLDDAIDDALQMSGEGLFLTPPTQPEIQTFRRWLCREVLEQATGAAPSRWSAEQGSLALPKIQTGWDAISVTEARHAVLAADDSSEIVAASRAALEILGYDDADDLLGNRIVSIVPERFRQAHLAGFTLYSLNGRSPLLGNPVVVPALRRDGTETLVELVIEAQPAANGHEVFVASLRIPDAL